MTSPVSNQFTEVAEVYDDLMSVVPYPFWVGYVRQLWERFEFQPRRVLELACGTGNVLAQLLRHGYDVAGVDYSPSMLGIARRKVPRHTPLWCQDARSLSVPGPPFDACVCLFDSLNYLLRLEELRQAFAGVRRALAPGGSFVFDMNAIRALETGMFDQQGTGRDASLEFRWHSSWEPEARLCTIEMEFQAHGPSGTRVFHETHVQRGYTLAEVRESLAAEGFEVLAVYDAFTTRGPGPRTDRFYCVARATEPAA